MLAIAGRVFDHAPLALDLIPPVLADQAQGIAVAVHQAIVVAEGAGGIAVAVGDVDQLACAVVAILHEGFHGSIVNDALDRGQAAERGLVVQVQADPTRCADVGEATVGIAGEVQVMAQSVFQALQGHFTVVVGHFAEIEEQVVEGLQDVVPTDSADQRQLFVRVVNALTRLDIDERNAAALVVVQVHEAAVAAQALFPGQCPATPQHAAGVQVTGIEP